MNKNQKIALGCGVAGCLGLILIAICLVLFFVFQSGALNRNSNFNSNQNSNFNSNSNTDSSSDSNANSNSNSDPSSSNSSSMSDDDKHKLFQAVGMTKDPALVQRVLRKIGLPDTGMSADYQQFVKDHLDWAMRNQDFVRSVISEEAARAYVNEHIDD